MLFNITKPTMTELDLNQSSLDSKDIESIKTEEPQVEEKVEDTAGTITVEELLAQQQTKEAAEEMRKKDEEMLKEISQEMWEIAWEWEKTEVEPVSAKEEDTQVEGDEPAQHKEILNRLKDYTQQKIAEQERKAWEAEARLSAEKKVFESEKQLLEAKLQELSKEVIETKHSTISAKDESVVKYNYLRQQFKEDADNPRRWKDLWTFHLRYASTYLWVDQDDLQAAINSIQQSKRNAKDAISSWYQAWGWVSNTNKYTQTIQSPKKRLNPNLLSK